MILKSKLVKVTVFFALLSGYVFDNLSAQVCGELIDLTDLKYLPVLQVQTQSGEFQFVLATEIPNIQIFANTSAGLDFINKFQLTVGVRDGETKVDRSLKVGGLEIEDKSATLADVKPIAIAQQLDKIAGRIGVRSLCQKAVRFDFENRQIQVADVIQLTHVAFEAKLLLSDSGAYVAKFNFLKEPALFNLISASDAGTGVCQSLAKTASLEDQKYFDNVFKTELTAFLMNTIDIKALGADSVVIDKLRMKFAIIRSPLRSK